MRRSLLLTGCVLALVAAGEAEAAEPATPSMEMIEYAMPDDSYWPWDVAAGQDGSVWFTASATKADLTAGRPNTPSIGRISPDGTMTLVDLPDPDSRPRGLVVDTEAGYFADGGRGGVYRLGLTAGEMTRVGTMVADNPLDVAVSADGTIWFTDFTASVLGALAADNEHTIQLLPEFEKPHDLVVGVDGAVWFTSEASNAIGRYSGGSDFEKFVLPTDEGEPRGICVGPDAALWFTEYEAGLIGRITSDGTITEFAIPIADAEPRGITAGADGALWFAEYKSDQIGRVTTDGQFAFYRVPTDEASLRGVTAGPDGSIWFAEYRGHKIGRLRPTVPALAHQAWLPNVGRAAAGVRP